MRPLLVLDLDPVLVHVGPFALAWYSLAVAAALVAAFSLTMQEARRRGLDADRVADVGIWAVAGGFVGARLLHVLDRWELYLADPAQILAVQSGGLAVQGAIVGGLLAAALAARGARLPVRRLTDVAAPGLWLGLAIGRFGCLVTGDALGPATDGTWGIAYLNPAAMAPELGVAYQPVFLYEQLWDLAIFAVIWLLRRRLAGAGQLFALALGLYAAGKFALTFLRSETIWLWGLQEAQLLAAGLLATALVWGLWGSRPARAAGALPGAASG